MKDPDIKNEFEKALLIDYVCITGISALEKRLRTVEDFMNDFYKKNPPDKSNLPDNEYIDTNRFLNLLHEEDWQVREWEDGINHFFEIRNELWKDPSLRNRFIGLLNHEIVDSDINKIALAKRLNKKFPNRVVVIARVQLGLPEVEIPSPERSDEI
jgi:hypothetical protein